MLSVHDTDTSFSKEVSRTLNFTVAQTMRPKLRQALLFISTMKPHGAHSHEDSKIPNLFGHAHKQQFISACSIAITK